MERIFEKYYHIKGAPSDKESNPHSDNYNYIEGYIVYQPKTGYYICYRAIVYHHDAVGHSISYNCYSPIYRDLIIECKRKSKKLAEQAIEYLNSNSAALIHEHLNIEVEK